MAKLIKAPRGAFDILPEEVGLWLRLEGAARDAFGRFVYGEIRTPVIEETRLFVRGIGDTTDIVEKEMYTIPPRAQSEDSITLRPEATAGIVRAYIEHNYHKTAPLQKFSYMGPMFRYERPQAGRQRQFHQIGAEVIGTYAPEADVETISLALDILSGAGLSGARLKVNSIGCPNCRPRYREVIRAFIGDRIGELCGDCKRRYERNIFRVLDCKQPSCRALIGDLPEIEEYLDPECRAHFERVKELLAALGVEFVKDKYLVRGFDYYTRTVYEIAHPALGARDAVAGGGRYDNLVSDLGGPPTGAVGFSIGAEATLLALKNAGLAGEAAQADRGATEVTVIPVEAGMMTAAFGILARLRAAGVSAEGAYEARSVKAQMREANARRAKVAVIVGPVELAAGQVNVKSMEDGSQAAVAVEGVVEYVKDLARRGRAQGGR